jgi:tetratricopeptide (TPR) repeat protein
MYENFKWIHRQLGQSHAVIALATMLITGSILLIQCTQQSEKTVKKTIATVSVKTVSYSGYTFELFTSPEQQLQYALTWFNDPNEKRAALELLIEHFPEAKTICAEADLELAYLILGVDYRFANSTACLHAIEKYQRIVSRYTDLPWICAKAHWYMGWIYADLLKQKRKAVKHYQTIVADYPDAVLSLKPPVPWVGLVLPQAIEKPMAVYEYPVYRWSSIALLEIIRDSRNEDEKWMAFEKLWSDDRASLAMGYAIRELLFDSPSIAQKVASRAEAYLNMGLFSQPMAEEVRGALESIKIKGGS